MRQARNLARWAGPTVGMMLMQCLFPLALAGTEFRLGEARLNLFGTFTYGTAFRAAGRDPELVPPASAAAIGAVGRAPGGQNADDSNLNFNRWDRVSSVLKGYGGADFQYRNFGLRVRAKAWHDFVLSGDKVDWGHVPNGYTPGAALNDHRFHSLAKFSGVALMDAYMESAIEVAHQPLFVRLGWQTIEWGGPGNIRGGLDQVNAYDIPAMVRPGAVKEEFDIPAPALFARFRLSERSNAEAFYQFGFEPNEIPGCGTFNSLADYAAAGCDKLVVGPFDDRRALAAGLFAKRAPDRYPSDHGQFGFGVTHLFEKLGRFGAYYANIHSRRWIPSPIKSARAGLPPLIPGDPDGRNVRYFIEYPEDIRIFGLTFVTRLPDKTALFAELTHQPNQTVRLNGTDLLNAFASNVAPSLLRGDEIATPPGGAYDGYDRLRITQLKFGGSKPLGKLLGTDGVTLAGEAGLNYVHDLPDPSVRRYGRADVFGLGPVNGACAGPSIQCSNDGYVTSLSWGYRMRVSALIAGVADGLDLIPSLTVAHDVKGWSHNESFSEKRKAAIVAIRGEVRKRYFAEISWLAIWGGRYDVSKDRDVLTISMGATF